MTTKTVRRLLVLSLLATLTGAASMAQAEQVWARVISATPVTESTGNVSYNVTYEYAGQRYTTRTDTRPGTSIAIDSGNYGVTTHPVAPQAQLTPAPGTGSVPQNWNNIVPEPGIVVSGTGTPATGYAQPAPIYAAPAPLYYPYPAPYYAYPGPYIYPPVGISLNLGYSRGWGGGWHGGHHWH